jgi:hypothetical protein
VIRLLTNLALLALSLSYLALGVLVPGFAAAVWAPYAGATLLIAVVNVALEAMDA